MPAVSTSRYLRPSRSRSAAMESRVVPGTSEAIMRSSPRAVHQRRLAHVRAADEGHAHALGSSSSACGVAVLGQALQHVASTTRPARCGARKTRRCGRRNRSKREIVERGLRVDAVDFCSPPAAPGGRACATRRGWRRRARTRLRGRRPRTAPGRLPRRRRDWGAVAPARPCPARRCRRYRPARTGVRDEPAHAVVVVAGHAGRVVHQRVAAAGQRVEQRRFSDVGTTDQGDERKHAKAWMGDSKTGYSGYRSHTDSVKASRPFANECRNPESRLFIAGARR